MTRPDDLAALEARLADLAGALELPPAPPLRDAVLTRIRAGAPQEPARRRPRATLRRRVALALLVGITSAGASLAIPQWRTALAGWLGIHGVTIEQRPGPLPTPTATIPPTPGHPGTGLGLGSPVSLASVAGNLDFTPLLPTTLGAPDAAWLRRPPQGGALSLVYLPGSGRPPASVETGVSILVTEFHAELDTRVLGKLAGPETTITEVQVGGDPAVWIAGAPHAVFYTNPDGTLGMDDLRLATNTLLWQHGSTLVRIEGMQSLDQAQSIAASMR